MHDEMKMQIRELKKLIPTLRGKDWLRAPGPNGWKIKDGFGPIAVAAGEPTAKFMSYADPEFVRVLIEEFDSVTKKLDDSASARLALRSSFGEEHAARCLAEDELGDAREAIRRLTNVKPKGMKEAEDLASRRRLEIEKLEKEKAATPAWLLVEGITTDLVLSLYVERDALRAEVEKKEIAIEELRDWVGRERDIKRGPVTLDPRWPDHCRMCERPCVFGGEDPRSGAQRCVNCLDSIKAQEDNETLMKELALRKDAEKALVARVQELEAELAGRQA